MLRKTEKSRAGQWRIAVSRPAVKPEKESDPAKKGLDFLPEKENKKRDKHATEVTMIAELVSNALDSTFAGFVGVGLIFFYFAVIVSTAVRRIRGGDHMHH